MSGLYNFFAAEGLTRAVRLGTLVGHFGDTFNLMLPVFSLSLSLLLLTKMNNMKKMVLIGLVLMSSVVLFQTMTRSVWGAVFISFFVILFLNETRKFSLRNVLYAILLITAFIVVLARATDLHLYAERWFATPLGFFEDPVRAALLSQGWDLFKINPLLGSGIGSELFWGEQHVFLMEISGRIIPTAGIHNQYLAIAVEMGLMGLFVFLGLCCSLLKTSYQVFRSTQNSFFKAVSLAALAVTISYFAVMLVGGGIIPHHDSLRTTLYFWVLIGIVGAIRHIEQKAKSSIKAKQVRRNERST